MLKQLSYTLKGTSRELQIFSHFKNDEDGGTDTGQYTVKENWVTLGNMHVNEYIKDNIEWTGEPGAFTQDQLNEIAEYIRIQDTGDEDSF